MTSAPAPTSTNPPAAAPPVSARALDVLAVPSGHPYVQHLLPVDTATAHVRFRPDPDPDRPSRPVRAPGDRWWPPAALDVRWHTSAAASGADLLHVHFGVDARTPAQLAALVQTLGALGRPLVLTLHDLRSPHQADPRVLDAQLDVLVPAAAAVLTLTEAAARRIGDLWSREAVVTPHPHVVPLASMSRLRSQRFRRVDRTPVVGVAVKGLRPNTDPLRVLPAVERATRAEGARLRVSLHRDLFGRDEPRARALVDWLAAAQSRGVVVDVHDRLDDDALFAQLAALDVAVLPYRFGTHSGWLEACHDVGTRVAAPTLGCYGGPGGQGADAVYTADEDTLDERSLEDAVRRLLTEARTGSPAGLGPAERARQRDAGAATLVEVYRRALHEVGR